jgi:hypothetical protein
LAVGRYPEDLHLITGRAFWADRVRYGVAVGVAAATILLRLALNPVFGSDLPFITFYPAVVVIAWLAGFWPGVLTTLVFAAAADHMNCGRH